jgi:excisionase family DNA binding protein
MHEIMTPEQAADHLQLNTDTVYRLIRRKELAAGKVGRSYRIPKEDVEDFLLAHIIRPEVQRALFRRVLDFAEKRNPGLSSDDVLEELERMDEERRSSAR